VFGRAALQVTVWGTTDNVTEAAKKVDGIIEDVRRAAQQEKSGGGGRSGGVSGWVVCPGRGPCVDGYVVVVCNVNSSEIPAAQQQPLRGSQTCPPQRWRWRRQAPSSREQWGLRWWTEEDCWREALGRR
jgi:hypothetical protein